MKSKNVLVFGLVGESIFLNTDHFHQLGETIIIDNVYKEPGGKGYNQAIAIKRMGIDVAFVGCVGQDEFGFLSKKYLEKEGISDYIIMKKNIRSSFATILTDKDGFNQVSVYPGGSHALTISDVDGYEELFDKYEYVLIQLELEEEVTKHIIKLSKKHHNKLVINPAPYKSWINDYLEDAYMITPNLAEALSLFKVSSNNINDLIKKVRKHNILNTIVTLGEKGSLLINNKTSLIVPPLYKVKVVDTTGAGDELTGTIIAMIIKGKSIEEALVYANFASLMSIQKKYVLPSLSYDYNLDSLEYISDDIYEKTYYDNVRFVVRCFIQNDCKYGMLRIKGYDIFGNRNHLETPGGGIEPGESEMDAVRREIKEETGYDVVDARHLFYAVYELNLVKRLNFASYYLVSVSNNSEALNLTDYEQKLFKGLEWYTKDELLSILESGQNPCDLMIHKRELKLFRKFILKDKI